MYPILILRAEFICLVILVFLFFISRAYNVYKESKSFARLLNFAILHVIFDATTVYTVNNMDKVAVPINWICHVIFYISAIFYSNEIVNYAINICYPKVSKKLYALGHFVILVYIICLSFLKIEYVIDVGTYSSTGPAAVVGYGVAFSFFIIALVVIFTHLNLMSSSIKSTLIPMMIVLMITECCQIIYRSVLFTGGAVTIVTVGYFFSLENPVEVFRKKAMVDALTGVLSRNSYEEDIMKLDEKFQKKPGNEYTFVFCDLNGLRYVNNHFGHAEGDNYISLISSAIKEYMKNAQSIYRIGGDEFLIYYYDTNSRIIDSEIVSLREYCKNESKNLEYDATVAMGYATSSENFKSLYDVLKTADYAMYQNKAQLKNGEVSLESYNAKQNYVGLTDSLFETICASNNTSYPFITNMETNVTRISPNWKEYFGLDDEFFDDFLGMWKERIHPDYFEGYLNDVVATINGHQKYHNYDYLAKRKDGEYVMVSCHGSIHQDTSSGITYFTGYIVNHGMDNNIDDLTGLDNFDSLISTVSHYIDEKQKFSIIKLKLNNFARVNMLYGYNVGNEVIQNIAEIFKREIKYYGHVYCQSSTNFTFLFDSTNKNVLEQFYKKIHDELQSGIDSSSGLIPVRISGGAYINEGKRINTERIRSGLVFAVEESNYNQRGALIYYQENSGRTTDLDVSILTKIHNNVLNECDNFFLRYQPIIDISNDSIIGAEALLRFDDYIYGEIRPSSFISFLENDPCYYKLGLWILEQAISDCKKLQSMIPNFKINVNITALQLQNDYYVEDIMTVLKKHDFDPKCLVLELTERCKEMDTTFLAKKISEIRQKGILVAFDDLGTGYSTISLLMNIAVDEIKLDKEFVSEINTNKNYQLFVDALIAGQSLGLNNYNICFEGIENKEILNTLKQYNNVYGQGYYYSKPLVFDDLKSYIDSLKV